MKAAPQTKTVTTTTPPTATVSTPFFAPVQAATNIPAPFFGAMVQTKLSVGKADDKFEREADQTADRVMSMSGSAAAAAPNLAPPSIQLKAEDDEKKLRKKGDSTTPTITSGFSNRLSGSMSGGSAMGADTRNFMESRFGSDFSGVKIHTDTPAIQMSQSIGAQAFTHQNHVYFNEGRYQPTTHEGKHLLAHELTHVVQQGGAIQRKPDISAAPGGVLQRGILSSIGGAISGAVDIVGRALNYFGERAYVIPGFRMLSIILGKNPISKQPEARSAANILRAVVEFLPGGTLITQALDTHGVFERAGAFVEQQIATLGMSADLIVTSVMTFVRSLGIGDITDLGGVWERAKRIFTEPINRIKAFVSGVFSTIVGFIKDAVLRPLAQMASQTRGYDLLKAVLGRDPITGEVVPRTAETLIGGFMKLIGQEEIWNNLRAGNAIPRAWAWFQGVLLELGAIVNSVPTLIISTLQSLTIPDFLTVVGVFGKIGRAFLTFVGDFISWAGNKVLKLLEILFSVVAPAVMPYLQKMGSAISSVFKEPVKFVGNLVRAGAQGFSRFLTNIAGHLQRGVVGWLLGALTGAGLQLPAEFNLRGILSLGMQILGLTYANVRQKIVGVTSEAFVGRLEAGFEFVKVLVTQGIGAAWQRITEFVGNLRDMALDAIKEWITSTVIGQAVTKIASMLNPAGAVIQAIIAIYNTVMFFVERAQQIAQVVGAFVNSMSDIAAGNIGSAVSRVEETMGRVVPVMISFLARLLGLSGIADTIKKLIGRVRNPIEKAIDKVVTWIVAQGKRLFGAVVAGGKAVVGAVVAGGRAVAGAVAGWWNSKFQFATENGEQHNVFMNSGSEQGEVMVASKTKTYGEFLNEIAPIVSSSGQEQKSAFETAKRFVADIDTEKKKAQNIRDDNKVQNLLKRLALTTRPLMNLSGSMDASSTLPEFGGLSSIGFGTSATVRRLTQKYPPGGSNADSGLSNVAYNALDKRRYPTGASFYVRGHILNAKLGGTGNAWANLVPLTRSANSLMHSRFEKSTKNMVLNTGEYIKFSAIVMGEQGATSISKTDIAKRFPDPNKQATIDSLLKYEADIPTKIHLRAIKLTEVNGQGKGTEVLNVDIDNDLQRDSIDNYNI